MVNRQIEDKVHTAVGHSNIALVKYWGKRNSDLNLPTNSSVSMTLDDKLRTTTSVLFSERLDQDQFYINNELQEITGKNITEKSKFMKAILGEMRVLADVQTHALIVSENSFPSSSGMASSASGAATLVHVLNHALRLSFDLETQSIMARRISGSACRSLYGGVVEWEMGSREDGSDSSAKQVISETYWPELVDILAMVDSSKKKVSSSEGHELTVKTSALYPARPSVAEVNVQLVKYAVRNRDFQKLAKVVMRESNNMHATMLDSWPPIMYLNDSSRAIIEAVHELNNKNGTYVAAYTFDAGPNAHIITTEEHKEKVESMLIGVNGVREIIESHMGSGPHFIESSLIDVEMLKPLRRS